MTMIRPAETKDIPAVLHLLEQVNLVHHLERPDLFKRATKYGPEDLLSVFSDPETLVFIYEENGMVLGHAFCVLQTVAEHRLLCDCRTLYIDDICVDESARGKGIGKALFDHVMAYALKAGCHNITLNVWSFNHDAERFYQKMGFLPQKTVMERIL